MEGICREAFSLQRLCFDNRYETDHEEEIDTQRKHLLMVLYKTWRSRWIVLRLVYLYDLSLIISESMFINIERLPHSSFMTLIVSATISCFYWITTYDARYITHIDRATIFVELHRYQNAYIFWYAWGFEMYVI